MLSLGGVRASGQTCLSVHLLDTIPLLEDRSTCSIASLRWCLCCFHPSSSSDSPYHTPSPLPLPLPPRPPMISVWILMASISVWLQVLLLKKQAEYEAKREQLEEQQRQERERKELERIELLKHKKTEDQSKYPVSGEEWCRRSSGGGGGGGRGWGGTHWIRLE